MLWLKISGLEPEGRLRRCQKSVGKMPECDRPATGVPNMRAVHDRRVLSRDRAAFFTAAPVIGTRYR